MYKVMTSKIIKTALIITSLAISIYTFTDLPTKENRREIILFICISFLLIGLSELLD